MEHIPQKNTKYVGANTSQDMEYIKIDDNINKK
jgi:ATP/ADP translocase